MIERNQQNIESTVVIELYFYFFDCHPVYERVHAGLIVTPFRLENIAL